MVLLVNQLTIPLFADVANALAKHGKSVTLFTGKVEESHTALLKDIHVVHSIAYRRNSLFSRLLTWLLFTFHLIGYLFTKRNISHILVVTNPPLAPLVVSLIARWRKIPYSVLLYDLYPEALSQAGVSSQHNWIFTLWQKINPSVFDSANVLITLSESMKVALARYVTKPERIQVIPNWVETEYVRPISKVDNHFLVNHGLQEKLVVMYSGNMGMTHDLESLMEAAALMKDCKEICFVLIGDGAKRLKLVAMKEMKRIDNVWFLPYQSLLDFPYAMAAADIGVVTLGVGAEGISVPSKTYVNMAAGLCLLSIAPEGSELNRLVNIYGCGFTCQPRQPESIVRFLKEILKNPQQLSIYKDKARKASLLYGSDNANKYVDLIK